MALNGIPVLICAYNEESNISKLIKNIKRLQYNSRQLDIFLVNDGSTDKTSHYSSLAGATVIDLKVNSGKAYAFFSGLKDIVKGESDIFLSFDGDIADVSERQVKLLLDSLRDSNVQMTIGSVCGAMSTLSGQRGYKLNEMKKLLYDNSYRSIIESNHPRIGYGLETLLNFFVSGLLDPFIAGQPHPKIRFVDTNLSCCYAKLDDSKTKNKLNSDSEISFTRRFCQELLHNK